MLSDPAEHVPGGELHIDRIPGYSGHIGGVHGRPVGEYGPGDHCPDDMSKRGADSLKHLG